MKSDDINSTKSTKTAEATARRRKRFLKAYKESRGHVAECCEVIGIDRGTYYNWMKSSKRFATQIEALDESFIDKVEKKLYEHVEGGNLKAIQFFLETKGKKRGYIKGQFFLGDVVQREGAVDNEEFERIRKSLKL